MKAKFLYISIILFLTFLNSCNKKSDISDLININTDSKIEEANQIVDFYNKFTILEEEQSNYFKSVINYLESAKNNIDSNIKIKNKSYHFYTSKPYNLISEKTKDLKSPQSLDNKLQEWVSIKKSTFSDIKAKIDEVEKYMQAEDYKDDNGDKLNTLTIEINKLISKNEEITNTVIDNIEQKVTEAEQESLKNNPLKTQILQCREKLVLIQEITENAFSETNVNNFCNVLDKQYKDLENKINNTTKKPFPSSEIRKKITYEKFNKEVDEYLGILRKTIRNTKENNQINQKEIKDLDYKSERIRLAYNSFVE